MANLQSQKSQGFGISHLIALCLILQITAPLSAQQNGIDTGVAPESVLPAEPDTLEGRLEATLLMVKLARPELGKRYLAEILAMNPTGQELIALRNKYGTSTFLSFTNVEGLNPEASELLNRLQKAVETETSDPAYAASLLPKLAGTARERAQALTDLRSIGPYAVPPMLTALENGTVSRDLLIFNLARLGDDAVPPLMGALTSRSTNIRNAAVEVLGVLGSEEDVIWLFNSAFSEAQPTGIRASARKAIARIRYDDPRLANRVTSYGSSMKLLDTAIEFLAGQHEWEIRYEDLTDIPVWTWSESAGTVIETKTSRRHASIHFAERLAREAAELNPTNEDAPIVALAAKMIRDIEDAGWDQPVPTGAGTAHDLAVAVGPEVCNQVLELGIDHNIPGAALAAVEALGLNGSRTELARSSKAAPIIEALNYPHPRVQFAAAVSILQWEPNQSFSGASRVVEILTRAVHAGSKPDSVVIDPNPQRGTATANIFRDLGYDSSIATTGREGFLMAANSGGVELAVLHPNTIRWELMQTIDNLKADARTRNLPLVIYGPASLKTKYDFIKQRYQNVVYVNEAVSSLDVNRELKPVLNQVSPPPLTQEQRISQLQSAAYWLRWIATSSDSSVFDLAPVQADLIQASSDLQIADDMIVALGAIGTPTVQKRFHEFVIAPSMDMNVRRRSALQLAFHIQRYGLLLSPAEIDQVIQLGQGGSAPELSTALSSVLGSLKPSPSAVRKLIIDSPMSATPVSDKPMM